MRPQFIVVSMSLERHVVFPLVCGRKTFGDLLGGESPDRNHLLLYFQRVPLHHSLLYLFIASKDQNDPDDAANEHRERIYQQYMRMRVVHIAAQMNSRHVHNTINIMYMRIHIEQHRRTPSVGVSRRSPNEQRPAHHTHTVRYYHQAE